jgi:hypothetical protein
MSSSRSPSREFTGRFCIDDKLLYASGVRDFDRVDASVRMSLDFSVRRQHGAAWRQSNAPALGRRAFADASTSAMGSIASL